MTGAQTDPVTTPAYQVVSTLLQKIGTEVFSVWNRIPPYDPSAETLFAIWWQIRGLSDCVWRTASLDLSRSQALALDGDFTAILGIWASQRIHSRIALPGDTLLDHINAVDRFLRESCDEWRAIRKVVTA